MMARSALQKDKIFSLLLRTARLRFVKPLVSVFYCPILPLLPINRLQENAHWVAFHHPQPEYALHLLIIPKQAIASLSDAHMDDPNLYADLFVIIQKLITAYNLEHSAYRLISNGGQNQSIPLWHWHLICDEFSTSNNPRSYL